MREDDRHHVAGVELHELVDEVLEVGQPRFGCVRTLSRSRSFSDRSLFCSAQAAIRAFLPFASSVTSSSALGLGSARNRTRPSASRKTPSVTVGDFNRDGMLDPAVANFYSNDVSVLLGNGDGSFQAAQSFGVSGYPTSVVAADFNSDRALDAAVASQAPDNLSVLINNTIR